jgi:hypothetical protein
VRRHLGNRPFKCKICSKSFESTAKLKRHEATHSKNRPFQCLKCPASFITNENLLQHNRQRHEERKFKCQTCEMTFYYERDLRKHAITHTNEKMKRCELCDMLLKNYHWLRHSLKHIDELEKREVLSQKSDTSKFKDCKKEISAEYSVKTEEENEIPDGNDWNKAVHLIKSKINKLMENTG